MKKFLMLLIIGLTLPVHALGQVVPVPLADACKTQTEDALAREDRFYRRVLFGFVRASEETIGGVRYDKEGNAWFKSGANAWRSQAKGFTGTTWSDTLMDQQVERDWLQPDDARTFRRGIFATRGVLTSELIPPITQSFRALQCRTYSVCEAVLKSLNGEESNQGTYIVRVPGCRDIPISSLPACKPQDQNKLAVLDRSTVLASCAPMVEALLKRESEMLTLSVTYDAAYRSLLQFAGTFDDFLSVFRLDLLRPVRQSLPLLQQLSRIPCFLAQCNG